MSFTPVVRSSNSIVKSLIEFAKDRKVDTKVLDFELISYNTLLKKESDEAYTTVDNPKDITLEDKKNPTTIMIQEYSIKIMPASKNTNPIKLSLATNKLKTKAIVTIKEGSVFHKTPTLMKEIKNSIWHKKLRAGLLIDLFEDALDAQLAKLFKVVPDKKALKKDLKFHVALGIEPIAQIDAKYDKVFEEFSKESDSIIDGIEKGILVLKYIKPIAGVDGRSCTGKYIKIKESDTSVKKPSIDATITEKEQKTCIEYFANDNGYVLFTKFDLKISKTLKLDGADFKSSANIDAGEENKDVSVHIGHNKSDNEDAIGSGVKIDVKELNVEGSVAANVSISTQELNIDAQTHKNSKMEVKNTANIKLHRGDLTANEANIDVLESGKVTAHKSVYVKQMVGGTAIAPIVKVDKLISNSIIIASELIEIETILGFDNTLIIDPYSMESYQKDVQDLKETIGSAKKSFDVQTKNLNDKIDEHASRAKRIKTFQERIIAAKQSGRVPVKQDILRIKQYQKASDALKISQNTLANEELHIQELEDALNKMYNKDLYAKITSKTMYDGRSKIIFKNSRTNEEIPYTPNGTAETISLVLNDAGDRIIKVT